VAAPRSSTDTTSWSTRERILVEASRLFAVRGFAGTSTRDIATAVGIRQPSMYSHFASKQAIAAELLERDLAAAISALEGGRRDGGGPAVELYRYLVWEVGYDLDSPFDLRSLYAAELLDLPELEGARRRHRRYDTLIGSLIRRGMDEGVFVRQDAGFVRRAIDGIVMEAIRSAGEGRRAARDEPELAAAFVVRALLVRPAQLASVQRAAAALDVTSDGGTADDA
jgi:AcrR family transcriptional regulator